MIPEQLPGTVPAETPTVGVAVSAAPLQSPQGAVSFTIQCPPSLNVQSRFSIGKKKRFKDDLALEMRCRCPKRVSAHERLTLAMARTKRVVKFTRFWYVGKVAGRMVNVKELDKDDNLPGACKPVLDELKLVTWRHKVYGILAEREGLGLIFDDKAQYCCAMYDQKKDKDRAGQLLIEVV